nr:uncharacterized protein LOC123757893 isoform X2 [Procambarus clarkii]
MLYRAVVLCWCASIVLGKERTPVAPRGDLGALDLHQPIDDLSVSSSLLQRGQGNNTKDPDAEKRSQRRMSTVVEREITEQDWGDDHGKIERKEGDSRGRTELKRETETDTERERRREMEIDLTRERDRNARMKNDRENDDSHKQIELRRETESDRERESRREMEIDLERERDRNARRVPLDKLTDMIGEIDRKTRQSLPSTDMERQRALDRQVEIASEVAKAEQKKSELLNQVKSSPLHESLDREPFSDRERYNERDSEMDKDREINLQRERDRALRSGNTKGDHRINDRRDPSWSGNRDDDRVHDDYKGKHRDHRFSHTKEPILIIEEVTPQYSRPSDSRPDHNPSRPLDGRPVWRGTTSRPLQDPRRPDRPPILPRPSASGTNRRPDRPVYPSRYDEVHLSGSVPHQGEVGFPVAGVLPLHPPPLLLDNSLTVASQANAATKAHLALGQQLGQAILAEQALKAQHAIQADKIQEAAIAAHLVGQAAAQQIAAQHVAAQQIAVQQIAAQQLAAQQVAAQQIAAQQAAAQQVAAQEAVAQQIAGGATATRLKASQLSHAPGFQASQIGQAAAGTTAPGLFATPVDQGTAAAGLQAAQLGYFTGSAAAEQHLGTKAIIRGKLKDALRNRLKTRFQLETAGTVSATDTQAATQQAEAFPSQVGQFASHLQQIAEVKRRLRQAREELFRRLTLLKPYFEQSTGSSHKVYTLPSLLPNLPKGAHLTPNQVALLPKIPIQVQETTTTPSFHIPDLKEAVEPHLKVEYVEYILSLPEDIFNIITNMSKREFLLTLFPRFFRNAVRNLTPYTPTNVLDQTPAAYFPHTTPSSSFVDVHTHQHYHHHHPPPNPATPLYQTPKAAPALYQPSQPSSPAFSYETQAFTPRPPVSSSSLPPITSTPPHRVVVTTSYVPSISSIPSTTPLIVSTLHPIITTTFRPPTVPAPTYGAPKPSSILRSNHHHDGHRHDNNQQQHHDDKDHHHDPSSEGQYFVYKEGDDYHHIHVQEESHHSTHPKPRVTVKDPSLVGGRPGSGVRLPVGPFVSSYSSLDATVDPSPHPDKSHFGTFHVTSEGFVIPSKETKIRPGDSVVESTTPVATFTPVMTGVGLRPHGGQHQYLTPISTTPIPPLSSIAPFIYTTTLSTPISSPSFPTPSYAPPLPSVTPAPLVFTTTYSPSISFTSSFPPITTNVHSPPIPSTTHSPRIPTTSYSPPISTPTHTPPILTTSHNPLTPNSSPPVHTSTTTYSPPVVSTTSSPPAANTTPRPPFVSSPRPFLTTTPSFEPATTPILHVTEIPATTTSSAVFHLTPVNNGQFLPGGQGGNAPSGALPHGSTRGPRPLNSLHQGLSIAEEVYPDTILRGTSGSTTGKLTTTTTEVLQGTPFSRFPGTDANDDDHVLSLFNNRKGNASSVDDKAPPPHQLQELQVSPSPHPLSPPSTVSNRKPPMPQLVRGDGVPLPPSPEGLVTSPVPPQPASFPGGPSPDPGGPRGHVTAEDLAKLPAYLREAPTCATNRSFCLMPLGYPREVAASLVSTHREEMSEITRVLANLPRHELDLSSALQQFPYIDTSVECESEERTVYLSWSRDLLGSWFVIMQTPPFTQPVNVTTCSSEARKKGCRPLLQAQPLLALHPRDPQPRPFLFDFPLPVACVFVGPLQSASSSPVTVVNTPADQQLLTSPLPDQSVTSPSADSDQDSFLLSGMPHTASRQTVDSLTSPTSELPLSLSVTSSFYHSVPFLPMTSPSSQQVPPFAMTSPSSQPIPSAFGTSQAFPRALLPLRPAMLLHDVSVEMDILNDEVEAKVTRNAGCTDLCQTQFLMLSLSFILLVQR